jgi:MFS family permease
MNLKDATQVHELYEQDFGLEEARHISPDQHIETLGATHEVLVIDEAISKRIRRKYDFRILPLFLLINLFSFIDRVNIGNARLLGLAKDLQLAVGLRYNIALMCLFVSYCVVELPSNILCKKVGGHIWIPALVLSFSILTICTSVVQNRGSLYAIRFLLGCAEGGISPGLVWMLSQLWVELWSPVESSCLTLPAAIVVKN